MAQKKQTSSTGVGIAVAAAVVAAAGVAFLYGTDSGKKSRKKIKGWTLKAKGEILEKLESAKEISEETFEKIAEQVLAKYSKVKSIEQKELDTFAKELKGHWRSIKKELATSAPKAKKAPAKKAAAKKTK